MSATSEKALRVGLIGLGGAAERIHVPALKQTAGLELVGGCDPSPEAREKARSEFGLDRVWETTEQLLAEQSPDVVLVGSPPESHFELTRAALEAGVHVFCEKPFMETADEAEQVLDLARARGLLVAVNSQYRYMEIYRRTRERIASGELGRLYAVQCWQQMFHPPAKERVEWRQALKRSTLYEFGTHALDLICCFMDDLPEAISARTPRARAEFDSDVLVQATLDFPQDRLATLWLNRVTHAPMRYLEMRLDCERASLRLSLGGVARAAVEWNGRPSLRCSFVKGGEAREERDGRSVVYAKMAQPAFMSATAAHLADFADRIRRGDVSLGAAEHAAAVLRTALAGYASAERGGAPVSMKRPD